MRIKLLSLVVTSSFITVLSVAQGLTINPGTTFKANAGISIVINNTNLVNNGNGDLSNSDVYLTGGSPGNIGGSSATTVSNLYINKNASAATLQGDLGVINNVVFQNGLLDLNGHNLSLSPSGSLVGETEINHITGSQGGYVSITVNMNAPSGRNPGNLGAIITSPNDLGRVLIQRGHTSQTNQGIGKSILRYFIIQPSNNSALNAVFRFTYLDAELNGLTESTLNMWKSGNGGGKWTTVPANGQNTTLNFVDINANVFSMYTLSSPTFSFAGTTPIASSPTFKDAGKISSIVLTPNPVHLEGNVIITTGKAFKSVLMVFSADGKEVIQQPLSLQAGVNHVTLHVNTLAAGAYYLVTQMSDGTKKTIFFTKQ